MKLRNKIIIVTMISVLVCAIYSISFATEETEIIENNVEENKTLIATNEEAETNMLISTNEETEDLFISNKEGQPVTIKRYGITRDSTEFKLIRLSIATITFIGIVDLSLSTLGKFDKGKRVFTFILGMMVGLILASLGCGYYYKNCVKYVAVPISEEIGNVVTQE